MIYESLTADAELTQGEIIDRCPLLAWVADESDAFEAARLCERVIILTQACDLANPTKTRATVAIVHTAATLADQGTLKSGTIRDNIRTHRT